MKFESKAELTKWALETGHLWLFLDYDGTLADFAATPDEVVPNPEIVHLMERLAHRPSIRVTILSGRRLKHIRHLLPISGIFLAGTYGIELLTPTGETLDRVAYREIRPLLEETIPQWQQIITGRKGFYLEDKDWALALHARFADDAESELVLARAREALNQKSFADRFRILDGHKFLEIAPSLASKRETVSYLLERYPFPNARLLYIGDDDKDEEAFSVIHANQGVAVKVLQPSQASRPTEADFFFESPTDTLHWLEQLV